MKAIILAAGKGVRMLPLTASRPKPMIPIVNIPILEHIVDGLRQASVLDILFVTGYQADAIERHFGKGDTRGVRISYVRQEQPEGTARAALLGEEFAGGEPFLLGFGDIMTPKANYLRLIDAHLSESGCHFLSTNKVLDPYAGAAVYVEGHRVVRIVEKPKPGTSTTNLNNAGIFIFQPEMFELLRRVERSPRGEYELPSAITLAIAQGQVTRAFLLQGYWSNVTAPEEVISLNARILSEMAARVVTAGGDQGEAVFVGADTEISPRAMITGPVMIGANSRIGASRIGPYCCLADGATVLDGSTVARSGLLPYCTVGRECRLEDALLGSNVVVADHVSIAGRPEHIAVVGDGSLVSRPIWL